MSWRLVRLADVPASAWRNGGGVTRELLAWPSPADWKLRISVADIHADGPFSAYPGVERWFAVLEGGAVHLRVAQHDHWLAPGSDPLRFDGAAPVACSLAAGATRDFNLMAPPGGAQLQRVRGPRTFEVPVAAIVGIYVHADAARVACGPLLAELPPGTFAWLPTAGPASVAVVARDALWVECHL